MGRSMNVKKTGGDGFMKRCKKALNGNSNSDYALYIIDSGGSSATKEMQPH